MTKLHEILAVDRDRQNAANALVEEQKTTFTKKGHLYRGRTQKVTFLAEDRAGENTEESSTVAETVQGSLDYLASFVGKHWDTLLTKEDANTRAFADLDIGGIHVPNLPSTFLLGLESRLAALRQAYLAIPTLDPAYDWVEDAGAGAGIYRAKVPTKFKTEKIKDHKIVVPQTEKFPAQVSETIVDRNVARVEEVSFSGMVTPARKAEMVARIDALIGAVKQARQRANETAVEQRNVADLLFAYIHGA
jgi:hypothetical protein